MSGPLDYFEPGTFVAWLEPNEAPINAAVTPEMWPDILRQFRENGQPFAGGTVAEISIPLQPVAADDFIVFATEE